MQKIANLVAIVSLSIFIIINASSIGAPSPRFMVMLISEPLYRLILVSLIVGLTYYNHTIGILMMCIFSMSLYDYLLLSDDIMLRYQRVGAQ